MTILEIKTRRGFVPGLGDRIRRARGLNRWSGADLGAELGQPTPKMVSRWETGAATPDALSLLGLSTALGVTVDWLLSGQERACRQPVSVV